MNTQRVFALAVMFVATSCGGDYSEMTVALDGMRAAVGDWRPAELVTLVLFAPRPDGAPSPTIRVPDPSWNNARDERRIVAWTGEDRMVFPVAWPRGTITEVRVQAVVATGRCGSVRTVLAEGEIRGLQWRGMGEPGVTITMRRVAAPFGIEATEASEVCR
jgi:hypothetical protein